jgi:hypothetical protein
MVAIEFGMWRSGRSAEANHVLGKALLGIRKSLARAIQGHRDRPLTPPVRLGSLASQLARVEVELLVRALRVDVNLVRLDRHWFIARDSCPRATPACLPP